MPIPTFRERWSGARRGRFVPGSALASLAMLSACSDPGTGFVGPCGSRRLRATPESVYFASRNLPAYVTVSSATQDRWWRAVRGTMTWSSTNPAVATVSASGPKLTVRAVAGGAATLIGRTARCNVTISVPVRVSSDAYKVSIDRPRALLLAGESITLKARVDGNAKDTGVVWRSTDATVLTVEPTGDLSARATGKGRGTALIIATARADTLLQDTVAIASWDRPLQIAPRLPDDLMVGSLQRYGVRGPGGSTPTVSWRSSDPSIATVTGGLVTTVGPGTVTITAFDPGDPSVSDDLAIRVAPRVGAVAQWRLTPVGVSGIAGDVQALWGSGPRDLFAGTSSGNLYRYDGTRWQLVRQESYAWAGIGGTSATDVFAATSQGALHHFDGTAWTLLGSTPGFINGLSVGSSTNVVMVGENGRIFRYDGARIGEVTSNTAARLHSVRVLDTTSAFAVGDSGTMLRYDQGIWSPITSGLQTHLRGVWGSRPDSMFAVGAGGVSLLFDSTRSTLLPTGITTSALLGIHGVSASDVFAVGNAGVALHFDGSAWRQLDRIFGNTLNAVWADGAGGAYIGGVNGFIARQSAAAGAGPELLSFNPYFNAVSVSSATNAVAVSGGGIVYRYDGVGWSRVGDVPGGLNTNLFAAFTLSPRFTITAGTTSLVLFFDGSVWTPMPAPTGAGGTGITIRAIHGSDSTNIFAVGNGGFIMRYDGRAWTQMTSGTNATLFSVWVVGPTLAYAVGTGGTVLRWDGASWKPIQTAAGATENLLGVWASDASNVIVVGSVRGASGPTGGFSQRYDGGGWTRVPVPTTRPLQGVWGSGPREVYAVGDCLFVFDGSTWRARSCDTGGAALTSISGLPTGGAIAVGQEGVVMMGQAPDGTFGGAIRGARARRERP